MRQHKKNILVTRSLDGQQREYARILGLNPIEHPALEFEFPDYWDRVLSVINEHLKSDWVFTSTNGVKALAQMMQGGLQVRPEVQLFAVGSKTREALQELGLDAKVPFRQDGVHLAELIADESTKGSVIYFHGNISRDEMADSLRAENIGVIEIEVYKTRIRPVTMPREAVEAILFYSPSAVEGFARGTGFDDAELPALFAIGPTTAAALEEASGRKATVAGRPDTKMLLQAVAKQLFRRTESEH